MDSDPAPTDGALRAFLAPRATHEITRFLLLRLLGALYAVAFLVLSATR